MTGFRDGRLDVPTGCADRLCMGRRPPGCSTPGTAIATGGRVAGPDAARVKLDRILTLNT